jgi:phosphoglycolate phosphatase-like HAD superfamily hydrolase
VPEDLWRIQLPKIREPMCSFVRAKSHELCANLLPQVRPVLDHLAGRGAKLGVATDNLEEIGKRKLEAVQILDMFQFCGWSDAFEHRSDVFRAAGELARSHAGALLHISCSWGYSCRRAGGQGERFRGDSRCLRSL